MSNKSKKRPIAEAIRQHLNSKRLPADAVILLQVPIDSECEIAGDESAAPRIEASRSTQSHRICHSKDFASVLWADGMTYSFTPRQRPVVAMLWHAMTEGTHFVGSGALLEAAEVNADRLRELFRGNKAWGKIIVQGIMHGGPVDTYRLAPLDDDGKDGAE